MRMMRAIYALDAMRVAAGTTMGQLPPPGARPRLRVPPVRITTKSERSPMLRPLSSRGLAVTALVALATPAAVRAQGPNPYEPPPRGQFTPFGAYQWGGTYDTDAFGATPAGKLKENDGFSWGAILSFHAPYGSSLELFYLRQDTNINFTSGTSGTRDVGGFANNYIQIGGRRDFPTGGKASPFLSASLGTNILDAKGSGLGSSWHFAWTLGGGTIVKANDRVGLRMDVRWMVTPVSSGTYANYCTVWGCYVASGRAWLHQGNASGGLAIAF
jgi:opacity protein-like surface antigen